MSFECSVFRVETYRSVPHTVTGVIWDNTQETLTKIEEFAGTEDVTFKGGVLQVKQLDSIWDTVHEGWFVGTAGGNHTVIVSASRLNEFYELQ